MPYTFEARFLVWVVAGLASVEAVGQAAQGLLDGRPDHVALWMLVAAAALLGSLFLETIKSRVVA